MFGNNSRKINVNNPFRTVGAAGRIPCIGVGVPLMGCLGLS